MNTVAIVLNAPSLSQTITEKSIICADGGRNLLPPDYEVLAVVGDLDSVNPHFQAHHIVSCPVEKDYTDGERAIQLAAEMGFQHIVIYGASGGRTDHIYANLSLLALAHSLGLTAEIRNPQERIYYVCKGKTTLEVNIGDTISLLPFSQEVEVTNSAGLYYPYQQLCLPRHRAIGISNQAIAPQISFEITQGEALLFIISNQFGTR